MKQLLVITLSSKAKIKVWAEDEDEALAFYEGLDSENVWQRLHENGVKVLDISPWSGDM